MKRKRGRPRKYNTPGEAAAAKRLSSAAAISPPKKKDLAFSGGTGSASSSSKKFQLSSLGNFPELSGKGEKPLVKVAFGSKLEPLLRLLILELRWIFCVCTIIHLDSGFYAANGTLKFLVIPCVDFDLNLVCRTLWVGFFFFSSFGCIVYPRATLLLLVQFRE